MMKPAYANVVARWLILCAALVALMVAVGGYTRLSGSGLSITAWKPISGTLPPLSEAAWEAEFAHYQESPQYQKVNQGISLVEFKTIFWPEYLHRLLARTIGAVFLLPYLWFVYRRVFTRPFSIKLIGIFALGGLQGLAGWLMVKSGLMDDPQVSPFRLALHLGLALLLLALLISAGMQVRLPRTLIVHRQRLIVLLSIVTLQMLLGAVLAGMHGGLIYNTFPTMNGAWMPEELWHDALPHNIAAIQFLHRTIAFVVLALCIMAWSGDKKDCILVLLPIIACLQIALGIATLLLQVPLPLALTHQCVGLLLFICVIINLQRSRKADAVNGLEPKAA